MVFSPGWHYSSFGHLLMHESPKPDRKTDVAVDLADLLITPLIVGGVLILRNAFGYVAALGLLIQANLLLIGLIMFLLLQPFLTGVPVHWSDIVLILAMGSVCFYPLILFVRGTDSR